MASADERVEALIAEARRVIEEIAAEGRQAVAEAEELADENVRRFSDLRDELEALRAESEVLERDQEAMPTKFARATLEDDVDAELSLKDRYGANKERLEVIASRLPDAEAELQALSPRGVGHDNEVLLEQYSGVNRAAAAHLVQLRRLASEISDAASREAGHFEQVLEDRQGESWAWRQDVVWSDPYRERIGAAGNIPGEDRTRTVRADLSKLG